MDRATLLQVKLTILHCQPSIITRPRASVDSRLLADREMSVINSYLNDNAQTPLGRFVVYMLYKQVCNKHSDKANTIRIVMSIMVGAVVCCRAVSLHTVNSLSSRRGDMNSKSPAAPQFASPLSTIVASPSPDKNAAVDDDIDAAQVKVSSTASIAVTKPRNCDVIGRSVEALVVT